MIILIDQDGPLADFEKGFLDAWRAQFPNEHFVPLHRRRTFYVRDDYPKELRDKVESIYFAPGFYLNLPPVNGSLEALKMLVELGHDVRICTSPLSRYENCALWFNSFASPRGTMLWVCHTQQTNMYLAFV